MNYQTYMEILKRIEEKAPLESGVQALIYMLMLEKLKDKNFEVVIIDNMQKHSVFMSYGGISDLAIVGNGFNYKKSNRSEIKMCIEVKAPTIKKINNEQVKMQLLTYKKAIITNGKDWAFYNLDTTFNKFDEGINNVIKLEQKLANERGHLKRLRGKRTKRTKLVEKNKGTEDIDKEIDCKKEDINKCEEKIKKYRESIDAQIDYNSIHPECITINSEENFGKLCDKIDEFIV